MYFCCTELPDFYLISICSHMATLQGNTVKQNAVIKAE
jgi:hypothetical protein